MEPPAPVDRYEGPSRPRPRLLVPALLFVATIFSTANAGGPAFAATLMSILVAHEMGHFVAARIHRVPASLPYFIPTPGVFMLGTLGAVITMRTERADRNQLFDIGAAGPIAGFLVAVPAMIVGIRLSEVRPLAELEGPLLLFGDSILSYALQALVGPEVPRGHELVAHPVLQAAWAGFLVTAINLLPMGQLDGGHVLKSVAPDAARRWSRRTFVALLGLGLVGLSVHAPAIVYSLYEGAGRDLSEARAYVEWSRPLFPFVSYAALVWALMGAAVGLDHPPVEARRPLTPGRRRMAAVCLAIFVLVFMPSPLWQDPLIKG